MAEVFGDRFQARLIGREPMTDHICAFEFEHSEGNALPRYEAGAHIEVEVRPGLIRRYSLCGAPADTRTYRIAVMRDPLSRGGSATIHETWRLGDLITIGSPQNNFAVAPSSAPSVLFAGGIGITPILAMAYELAQAGRSFVLHYAARTERLMAFRALISEEFQEKAHLYFDDDPSKSFDAPSILRSIPVDSHVYVCGPAGFNRAVAGAVRDSGFQASQFHHEAFAPTAPANQIEREFVVQLASSGREYIIPGNRTIVETLDSAGVFIPSMCRQGICGMCLTDVLEGSVDHRDGFLTEAERLNGRAFLPCCSRASSERIVLDR